MEAGKEESSLQFRTAIPDLKLLPIQYTDEPAQTRPRTNSFTPRDPSFWAQTGLVFKDDSKVERNSNLLRSYLREMSN